MTESPWLTDLTAWAERQAGDDEPSEQLALGAQELLEAVPDAELVNAVEATDGTGLVPDALYAEIQRREIDL